MTQLSRRGLLQSAALAATNAALPMSALAADAPAADATGAAWDLSDLYASDAAWAAERQAVTAALPSLETWKGKLGQDAATLKSALTAIADLRRRVDRLELYASLSADADTRVAANQERRGQAIQLDTAFQSATAWVAPEAVQLGADRLERLLGSDAGLAPYRHYIENILRLGPHTLGGEAEGVLAAASTLQEEPEQFRTQLALSDIPWRTVMLSTGPALIDNQGYTGHRDSPVREDRKAVFDALFGAYAQFKGSLGEALSAEVQSHIFQSKSRHYTSSVEAALAPNNVPVSVYRTLIEEAHAGLPALQRYFELRKRLMKLDELHYYDLYPPITKLDQSFTIPQMRTLVLQAVTPLGEPYQKALAAGTAAKWMDPLPRKGKAAGAYENDAYGVHPYLLLNLHQNYEGLTTYAHEWGHAMHSVLADAAQPYPTAGYPIFLAEIASTNNEQLLNHLLVSQAKTPAERVFYLDQLLELFKSTFFRQTQLAEFELAVHDAAERGEGLSGDKFSEIYLKILKTYYEPAVKIDDAYAIEWAYIPHFYYNFYLFQYATCLAASAYFSDRTLTGGAEARDTYLNVLKAGGSDYPVDILKRAGLDMTSPTPYRALVAKFNRTLDQIEAELAKA
jgi:oligoendopeptidase F